MRKMTQDVQISDSPDKQRYVKEHNDSKISHDQEVLEHTYSNIFNISSQPVKKTCQEVRNAEIEMHKNAKETYTCILKHYGGDHPLSARLANPSGGLLGNAKKLINQKVNRGTRWYGISIVSRFVFLCLLHFDYVKDIGRHWHVYDINMMVMIFRYCCDIGVL